MNRILTLFFGLFFSTLLMAQQASKVDYNNDSRWFWTLNAGTTWSSTDVTKRHDWGGGLTIGKSFNYNYGKAFSFDIRGRYLTGKWYGYDSDTTGFKYANTALSTAPTDYKTAYGFSVLNYQTQLHELSLELVIHANNLKAKTGWDLFVFGGVGYTWFRTKGDLLDAAGNIYRYDSLQTIGKESVSALLDGKFDTYLDGTASGGAYTGTWMPSLGFGIGYQVGPRWSIGLEHKTTFTLDDIFDGYANPEGKRENDLYHYTSAYLRFHIRDHVEVLDDPDDNSLGQVNNYDQTAQNVPPIVDFRSPATSGTTVSVPTYVIRADVKNVSSANNVIFRQNGNYISNFSFNPSTQQFESTVQLQPGQNIFELTGTNNFGSDMEQTVIIYNREQQNPPIVNYVNPASSPTTVQNPAFNLSATVLNVTQHSQIAMTLNGQPVNFTFNASNSMTNATLNLQIGTNIVTTTGTNQYGTDSESTTIIYNPQQTEQPPVVYYVDPNVNPYTTSAGTFTINADVLNVADAQNITFKQNGSVNQNFTYNAVTDDFQSTVVLNPGQNVFEIIAVNTAGSAQATTIIIYERQAPRPPIVTITNPSSNPQETANAFFTLGATVLNVTQASQITVKLNNQNIANFTYTPSTNGVTANLNLNEGANVVTVTGTNSDGTDSKQTTIIYRKPVTVQPPVVNFNAPNVDPFTTEQPNYTVVATVLNVTAQSGVNVNVNGANVVNFTFNPSNSTVTLPLTLIEGANVITITGTNTAGTDSEPQTIIYRKPQPAQPPVVSFIDPSVNPTTVFNQTYDVKARVRFVQSAQQITLRINGQLSANFAYSASSEIMTFTTGLVPGANIVEITGTNAAGMDVEATTIIYREPNPTLPPVVTITNPLANPSTVNVSSTPIAATVLNVDGAQNIQVLVNSIPFTGFTYNTANKQLTFTMNLMQGSNTVQVTATNSAGQASDSKTILYRRETQLPPPFVTFVNPATGGTTVSTAGFTVKATVTNVGQASQVVVSQDGQIVSPNLWNFNASTKEVTFNTNLNAGNNVFTVTGTNTSGTHSATTNVIYTIPVVVCDKPVVTFTTPATGGTTVENGAYNVTVSLQHITSANQVKLLVNGALQSPGSLANGVYTKSVTLAEGQNALEVIATNNCGETKVVTTIVYKPAVAPCHPPVAQRITPAEQSLVVETETIQVRASVSNVDNMNQIALVVNGASVPFSYDNAAHTVTATISLVEGENTVAVNLQTPCGKTRVDWKITRQRCNAPTISVTSSTNADGTTTYGQSFGLTAGVTGVAAQNNISVTMNGQNIGFVYTPQTGVLTVDHALDMGVNKFVITATNNCGQNSVTHSVIRRKDPNAVPPTIQITNPAATPFQTQQSGMTVNVATTHVTAANQVIVTVNGAATNFSFNASNGTLSLNAHFNVGANVIVATAATPYGTATDTKTVIYTAPVVVNPPVITLTNPTRCPAAFPRGTATITGTVSNISNPNQVTIQFNGANVSFQSTIVNNTLNFSFNVTMMPTMVNAPLVITATNEGGTDVKTCAISFQAPATETEGGNTNNSLDPGVVPIRPGSGGNGNNGHGNNGDGNDESNPGQGQGGPNGTTGGPEDDENGNGNGGRGGQTTQPTTRPATPVTKPGRP